MANFSHSRFSLEEQTKRSNLGRMLRPPLQPAVIWGRACPWYLAVKAATICALFQAILHLGQLIIVTVGFQRSPLQYCSALTDTFGATALHSLEGSVFVVYPFKPRKLSTAQFTQTTNFIIFRFCWNYNKKCLKLRLLFCNIFVNLLLLKKNMFCQNNRPCAPLRQKIF